METPRCPRCGGEMRKNGRTSAGRTRWRCKDTGCGASRSRSYARGADDVRAFLDWLLSADTQEERGVSARTPRRRNELAWSLWPPCPMDGQIHDVVHLDGIHLGRKAVVPIAYAGGHVIGWYVARRETSAGWMSLMARIAEPVVVVCDGAGGIHKALRHAWPHARVQRRLLHICLNIGTLPGRKPRYEASRQLLHLTGELTRVRDGDGMVAWLGAYNAWEMRHRDFLEQRSTWSGGSENDLHQRLVKARNIMRRRIRERTMFTFMDPELGIGTPVPTTNNAIESQNARIRAMLRDHRGLCLIRRIKAVCWWCHQHTEHPESPAWLARHAWRDEQIEQLYRQAWEHSDEGQQALLGIPARYGTGIDWNEFHTRTPWHETD